MELLEEEKRLSESQLWKLQYNAYHQFGLQAWSKKGVPFYVTSNPFTASAYANMVFNYLKDTAVNLQEPFYLFDLGAGTGRFAFLFLKNFKKLLSDSPFSSLKFCYIMTDCATSNFLFWKSHPSLKPFFDEGVLDFCYYLHTQTEQKFRLEYSQKWVEKPFNPMVIIANYFFDTIPQDLYRVHNGRLEEGFISLHTSKKWSGDQDPELINDLSWSFTFKEIDDTDSLFLDAPQHRQLLLSYRQLENATFLFPSGALDVLDFFKKFSDQKLLLLAGDQGVATLNQIQTWDPKLALHGSFSLPVSYYTLAEYFSINLGEALLSRLPDPAFVVIAGVLSKFHQLHYETKRAFRDVVDGFDPQDYWRLGVELEKSALSLEAMLLLTKLGHFDPMIFHSFFNAIRKELPFASNEIKERLIFTIRQIDKNFFPIERGDGGFLANLGVLFFDLALYKEALVLFEKAKQLEGNQAYLLSNINHCRKLLAHH
ncbi:MAG: SAM-dependent methyltransferase [Parachlamydiaceae bacterium]